MTLAAIPSGAGVFVDANILLYYFTAHTQYGRDCQQVFDRVENKDVAGFTSSHVLAEVAHRLMTIEACQRFGWPVKGIAARLRKHPAEVQQLNRSCQAVDEITLIGLEVLPVAKPHVSLALDISRQYGLLCGDALVVAMMRDRGLSHLASNDADFDRVPGLTRFTPI